MAVLPDELWTQIIEIGIKNKTLNYKSVCCLSITCPRLRQLSDEDSIWSTLLLSDFPNSSTTSSTSSNSKLKTLYKIRYEKDRERKRLAHRRVVLRIESDIAECSRKIREIEFQSNEEKDKTNKTVAELVNLRRVRQASVALNVWQPEIIRGRHKQMIQQNDVPVDVRIKSLEMEINLCKQQIAWLDTTLRLERRRLDAAREKLASVKYHPLQDFSSSTSSHPKECRIRNKKLKQSSTI